MPKVSVCIPTYNQIEFLKKTIDSVLRQTYTDYEIIITDDSKTDIVFNFVKSYNLPDKIKYFKNSQSLGSPNNWNEAIKNSTGEYLKIVHHDDWFNYDYSLAHYVRLLDDNPEAELGFSASRVIFNRGDEWIHSVTNPQLSIIMENPLILLSGNIIGAPSAVIVRNKKDILYDPNLKWLVDLEYYLRKLDTSRKIVYDPEPLIVTFEAEGRVTDECKNNKDIQIFEFFYTLDSIKHHTNKFSWKQRKAAITHGIFLCKTYNVKSLAEIRTCGYTGPVSKALKFHLFINKISPLLGRLFLKIWQKVY